MAQRQCIAAARRFATQHERIWMERKPLDMRIRTQQRRAFSPTYRQQAPRALRAIRPQKTPLPTQHLHHRIRLFTTTPHPQHGDLTPPKPGEERHVTFIDKEGQSHTFEVSDGDNLLDIAQANDLEMEGACGGSCACSTCHVIVADGEGEGNSADDVFDRMEEPSDDENDMLDLAFGLTETSRLGCQVVMRKDLDGLVVKLPSMTRNMQASDFADKK